MHHYIYMIWCRKYVDEMLRKCAGMIHYTDPAIKGRQKDTSIIHVTRRRMYITTVSHAWLFHACAQATSNSSQQRNL